MVIVFTHANVNANGNANANAHANAKSRCLISAHYTPVATVPALAVANSGNEQI